LPLREKSCIKIGFLASMVWAVGHPETEIIVPGTAGIRPTVESAESQLNGLALKGQISSRKIQKREQRSERL
jgi:hypothetical protein